MLEDEAACHGLEKPITVAGTASAGVSDIDLLHAVRKRG